MHPSPQCPGRTSPVGPSTLVDAHSRTRCVPAISYICLVCGQSHPWCGTFDAACLQHRIFHVKCRSCNMNFASVIIATDHFNTHTAITMLGYQSVPVTGLTINRPTYIPTMVMINRSPPPSPAVLLHMIICGTNSKWSRT